MKDIVHHCNEPYSFKINEEHDFEVGWENVTNSPRWKRSLPEEQQQRGVFGSRNENYNAEKRPEFYLGVQRGQQMGGRRILSTLEYERELELKEKKGWEQEGNLFIKDESDEETESLDGEMITNGGAMKQMKLGNKINEAKFEGYVQDKSYDTQIDHRMSENRKFRNGLDEQTQQSFENFRKHLSTRNGLTKYADGANELNTAPFGSAENFESNGQKVYLT